MTALPQDPDTRPSDTRAPDTRPPDARPPLAGAVGRLALGILLGALALGCSVGLMAVSAWLISRAAQHPEAVALATAATAVRVFGIGRALLRYSERLVTHDAAFRIMTSVRVRVYTSLERLAPAGLPAFRRGDLLSRIVGDVDAVQEGLLRVVVPYGVAAVVSAGTTAFLWLLLPGAGAVMAGLAVAVGLAIPLVTAVTARSAERRVAPLRGDLSAAVLDLVRGAEELVSYGAAARHLEAARVLDDRLTAAARRSAWTAGVGAGLATAAGGLACWACLTLGSAAVSASSLDPLLLATVTLTPLAAFEAVGALPMASQVGVRVRVSLARLADLTDRARSHQPEREPDLPVEIPTPPYDIVLRDVTAQWQGSDATQRPALDGVSLAVPHGTHVAVLGRSGAGKTTLAWVLARFLDQTAGEYRIAGTDATAIRPDDVRRVVLFGAHDAHVFRTSVRENLRVARAGASEADMWRALDRARIGKWVRSLPAGLDTMLGEDGSTVSGGQRQRLMLARVLLVDAPVVILDEPTEHLDLPTADALVADLHETLRGRTLVMVTHRREGIEAWDRVVVLDRGRVAASG